ncbi:M43 family zinc metalloprotease [Flavobacterium sp. 25HG05S-40]|uniref:M43 family zinc metalloprotease n=1 Tax=Flavobacterium sp. 25HG05S-40 TaxID=3458682 RepID=UPI004043BB42
MRNFILSVALVIPLFIFAQSNPNQLPCATDKLMQDLTTDFPEVRQRLESFNQMIKESSQNKNGQNTLQSIPLPGSITIPVVVYIIHDGTTLTNISDAQVNDQMAALNNYFYSTGIKFCLATKVNGTGSIPTVNTTDVQTTPGIIHINNATLSNHYSTAQLPLVATANPQITKERYIRIWVVKSIDGPNSGTAGYSMFPNTSPVFDGIVMRYNVFGNGNPNLLANYNLGKVLAHEVGHYLFLYHTFEGGCSTYFNDCSMDGDRVCDTPRVASPNFNCVTGTNSCPETPAIPDDLSNYMDYGNNNCQDHFSNGQIERMLNVLQSSRSQLYATENTIYTGTCGSNNLLSATITPSDFSPCASSTLATIFTAPTATTYSWNFGDAFATGANPNTATTQFASHIYTSAANSPYTVTLTVTNAAGETRTSSEQIFVTNCQPINNVNSYWFVDGSYGLSFSTGRPIFDPTFSSTAITTLSDNSQCDSSGNLLFYTDKYKIMNRQHVQINSTDLMEFTGTGQSNQVLIVPKPPLTGNLITQYYIFTQQTYNSNAADVGFRYSIVNISGTNATMGAYKQPVIVPSNYGFDYTTDGAALGLNCLTAVKKCNSNDYWILTMLKRGSQFYLVVFSLTNTGLIYNSEQLVVNTTGSFSFEGQLTFAPNGNKLALTHGYGGINCYIYDFNKAQGIISSNYIPLSIPVTSSTYGQSQGCSFSPDSNLFYMTDMHAKRLYQFNINSVNILGSRIEVGSLTVGPNSLRLGPDNKIYASMVSFNGLYQKLSVIHNPNNLATTANPNACNLTLNGPKWNGFGSNVGPGLPNTIEAKQETAYFSPNTPNVISKYITACNTYKFFPNVCGNSFVWTFTNTTTGTSITTTVTNPTYNFPQNGTYVVTVRDNLNTLLGTSSPIIITNSPAGSIDGSTTACLTRTNESITNNSTFLNNGETATWTITGGAGSISGAINNQPSVNISWSSLPGTITLTKVSASGCTNVSTKTISSFCATLGTNDIENQGLMISPNPSTGIFTISSTNSIGKVSMHVFDIRGRIILSQTDVDFNSDDKTLDLSGCQSGMYILKIIGSDFNSSYKLIKN